MDHVEVHSHALHDDEVETVLLVKLGPPVSAAEVNERYRETVSCDQVRNPFLCQSFSNKISKS